MEELLKAQGLTEVQIKAILDGMATQKIYTTSLENAEERYTKLKRKKEDAEEELKTANATITGLKKDNKDNEDLQATIKTHEATITTLKADGAAKEKELTISAAIDKILAVNKAKHSDLIANKFDREKLTLSEDGKVVGLDEQLTGIKETYKDMFEGTEENNTDPTYKYIPKGGDGEEVTKTFSMVDIVRENQSRK